MAKVVITHLSKFFSARSQALHDLTFEVADRECLAILGPAGSGKSTLLRLVAGLESPSAGDIFIGDQRVNDLAPKVRDVAMVFREASLYPAMTVWENIAFGLRRRHFSKEKTNAAVSDTARVFGVAELLAQKPDALSFAQSQRVALARAVAWQPKVLLLDDPLAHLEAEERAKLRAELRQLHERLQTTILFATADPGEALSLGERVLVLDEGNARQLDGARGVYERPANLRVAQLSGSPPMNLLRGTLKKEGDGVRFVEVEGGTVAGRLPHLNAASAEERMGAEVILGIRPEDMELADLALWPEADAPAFPMIAEYVEPRGGSAILHLQTGAHDLVCLSQGASDRAGLGRRVSIKVNLAKAHLFDPASSERIVWRNAI